MGVSIRNGFKDVSLMEAVGFRLVDPIDAMYMFERWDGHYCERVLIYPTGFFEVICSHDDSGVWDKPQLSFHDMYALIMTLEINNLFDGAKYLGNL